MNPLSQKTGGSNFTFQLAHHHLSKIRRALQSNSGPGAWRTIRNYLPVTIPPLTTKSDLLTPLGGKAFRAPQIDIQQVGEVYGTRIKAIIQDMSHLGRGDGQDIWKIAVNWLTKKFKVIHPEVWVGAMEDLRGIGLMVNPCIPKGQKKTLVTEYRPLINEENLSPGSTVGFEAPGPSMVGGREDFEITSQDHLSSPSHAFRGHGGEGSDGPGGWSLTPIRPILIIGDAKLAYLPLIEDNSIQVDSYPGWDMSQATFLLRNRTPYLPRREHGDIVFRPGRERQCEPNPYGSAA